MFYYAAFGIHVHMYMYTFNDYNVYTTQTNLKTIIVVMKTLARAYHVL